MVSNAIFTLLHDIWGDSSNESIRLVEMRVPKSILKEASAFQLANLVPEISMEKWKAWEAYFTDLRYKQREAYLKANQISVLLYIDEEYPSKIKEVHRPPAILYLKGQLSSHLMIGMVGSRKATTYGKDVAFSMAKALSKEGICIISGLAKGIDASAHKGALTSNGGTIGVLGCGIDQIYPRENKQLYEEILKTPQSGIISEWPLGSAAMSYHFPQRNRIIAGLSDGVLVVEAAAKSGSLITANLALENGKDVFAIPGMITSAASVGCHRLIKDGAKLVASPNDILEEYGQLSLFKETTQTSIVSLTDDEKNVLSHLSGVPKYVEQLSIDCHLPVYKLNSILTSLELKDLAVQHLGRQYSKIEV